MSSRTQATAGLVRALSHLTGLVRVLVPVLAVLAADVAAASRAAAQVYDPWVGARVVARGSDTKLKVGPRVSATLNAGSVFRVDRVQGDWLWVDSGNISGWLKKADVVPFEKAVPYFTAAIAANPSDGHAHVSRGIVRHARKEHDRAITDYTEAIRLNPADAWPYHDRAAAYHAKHDYDHALADAGEAVRLDPAEASHLANRAGILFARKDYDRAIADYTEAIRLLRGDEASLDDSGDDGEPGPTRGRLWGVKWTCARAECQAARSATERAIADYDEAIRLDPRDPASLNSLAWLLATCDDSRFRNGLRAFALAARASELTAYRNHLCLDTLAAAYAEAGDFAAAVRWQTLALDLAGGNERFAQGYRARMKLFRQGTPFREVAAP